VRIAFSADKRLNAQFKPDGIQDILMDGGGEVSLQKVAGNLRDQSRVFAEQSIDGRREATADVELQEITFFSIGVALPRHDVFRPLYFPNAVTL
jgi:hypothetical protein